MFSSLAVNKSTSKFAVVRPLGFLNRIPTRSSSYIETTWSHSSVQTTFVVAPQFESIGRIARCRSGLAKRARQSILQSSLAGIGLPISQRARPFPSRQWIWIPAKTRSAWKPNYGFDTVKYFASTRLRALAGSQTKEEAD